MDTPHDLYIANAYNEYAEDLRRTINEFNRVDTLSRSNNHTERAARKKVVEILIPVYQRFKMAAIQHGYEPEQ
jgi:hypothetical protein